MANMRLSFTRIIVSVSLLLATVFAFAANDTTFTKYKSQEFVTYGFVRVNSSLTTADAVVDDLIADFRGDPELLFEWALKGLGRQEEAKKNELVLALKETALDKMTGVFCILSDVMIADKVVARDIVIEGDMIKTKNADGSLNVKISIHKSNFLIKKAHGTFFVLPQKVGFLYVMRVNVTFNWFFNLFITQRRYADLIEWRITGFLNNMKQETERRLLIENKGIK
jgi:hypothetical protein